MKLYCCACGDLDLLLLGGLLWVGRWLWRSRARKMVFRSAPCDCEDCDDRTDDA